MVRLLFLRVLFVVGDRSGILSPINHSEGGLVGGRATSRSKTSPVKLFTAKLGPIEIFRPTTETDRVRVRAGRNSFPFPDHN